MTPILRPPLSSDYAALVSWIPDATACARWAGPRLKFPFTAVELPELLRVKLGQSYGLAAADGPLLGFGQFWVRDETTAHLGRIIISPGERGRRLGGILCAALIAKAVEETRAAKITLRVYRDNPAALSVYTKLGFRVVDAESNAETLAMEAIPNPRLRTAS